MARMTRLRRSRSGFRRRRWRPWLGLLAAMLMLGAIAFGLLHIAATATAAASMVEDMPASA
jgi:hypothetical protein